MSLRLAFTAAALAAATSMSALAVPLVGVTANNTLIGFDSASSSTVTSSLAVTGLGTQLIRSIDFRPATGQLYAIAQNNFSQPVGLYTINTVSGVATSVGTIDNSSQIDFDIAFNPMVDRLRVVAADNSNLRVVPTTGATTKDKSLAYAAGDVNFGTDPTVTGAAYTNQNPGPLATTTTLYDIDAATSSLVIQAPPNDGTLTTVGKLGVPLFDFGVGQGIGFDIDGATGTAFASLITATGSNGLYTINLATGAATSIGGFGDNTVRDIAVGSLGQGNGNGSAGVAVPEPASMALLAMGLGGLLAARRRAK